ncbi:hypothetical protein OROMI_014450 [Orobanche minor]
MEIEENPSVTVSMEIPPAPIELDSDPPDPSYRRFKRSRNPDQLPSDPDLLGVDETVKPKSFADIVRPKQPDRRSNFSRTAAERELIKIQPINDETPFPVISFDSKLEEEWRAPWENAIIIKTLGKSWNYPNLFNKLATLWNLTGDFELIDLGYGAYCLKGVVKKKSEWILTEGPWAIAGSFLSIRKWTPEFRVDDDKVDTIVSSVRVANLPMEFLQESVIQSIASCLGVLIKIDSNTYSASRGKFARFCVQMETDKPLIQKPGRQDSTLPKSEATHVQPKQGKSSKNGASQQNLYSKEKNTKSGNFKSGGNNSKAKPVTGSNAKSASSPDPSKNTDSTSKVIDLNESPVGKCILPNSFNGSKEYNQRDSSSNKENIPLKVINGGRKGKGKASLVNPCKTSNQFSILQDTSEVLEDGPSSGPNVFGWSRNQDGFPELVSTSSSDRAAGSSNSNCIDPASNSAILSKEVLHGGGTRRHQVLAGEDAEFRRLKLLSSMLNQEISTWGKVRRW